ncbi:cell wall protein DAN4-like [Grammomys surdaster]|uniref:cell wall protein DAN4-like n=1 Tax=Grammomys surdaster TaxID=491861 RepID=UPI00109F8CB8|nr:cell wall protein DAN4-like [Grammomys surdaster]
MAGSRLLPLALALLLLARPSDSSVTLACTGVVFTLFWESIITDDNSSSPWTTLDPTFSSPQTTPESTSLSSESTPTILETTPHATAPNTGSASPEPETASLPSSGFPSSEPTTASQSTNLAPQGSPTASSPGQDAGSIWISTSHRNPGVVIAVCLLVSVLLIGCVFIAVRHCYLDAPAFHNMDTVSMGSVSQRLPFADRLQS